METAAAVLLVTLIGPTILTGVCELTCAYAEHHAARVATAQSCHDQRPSNDGSAMTSGTAEYCHDQAQSFTTTAADHRLPNAMPVAVQLPSALVVYLLELSLVARRTSLGPPSFALQTTPLRI
jgi:hypothetical protein